MTVTFACSSVSMFMRILHFSDNHGSVPFDASEAQVADVVVCSGDMMPNGKLRADPGWNRMMQPEWITKNIRWFKALGRPFLFCSGNHDFIDPTPILRDAGVDAIDITNRLVTVGGYSFYGFPYIPYIQGEWNWEATKKEMPKKVREIPLPVDILVAHCPLEGMLSDPKYASNEALANYLHYEWETWPKAILCGHSHGTAGVRKHRNCIVSNAATTWRLLGV